LEARPLRQWNDGIPKELERICLKALSKRVAERYLTARDMAEELQQFVAASAAAHIAAPVTDGNRVQAATVAHTPTPGGISSDQHVASIVPKGLRSFDQDDADFYLQLLPGPRNRDGLPDVIRFWKKRIQEIDPDRTFAVGVLYGPSGCGKSSLVKAGLLPRLGANVSAVYVEAAADETEERLLAELRKKCPLLRRDWMLPESLAALRQGQGVPAGSKVLIVLDPDRAGSVRAMAARQTRSGNHRIGPGAAPMRRQSRAVPAHDPG
jgi:hypothetical protein